MSLKKLQEVIDNLEDSDLKEDINEALEDLKVQARYWNEARHIIDQPSSPRSYSEDIVALRDAIHERDKLEKELFYSLEQIRRLELETGG